MLRRNSRLRSGEVEEVIRSGKSAKGRFLSVKILPGEGDTMRYAAVVPKSLAGGAVERNRLRRSLYRALAALPKRRSPGVRAVLFLKKLPPPPETAAFKSDLEHVFSLSA